MTADTLERQTAQQVEALAVSLWETEGFYGARRVLAYEALHAIDTDAADELLIRGIREEPDALFIDVRFACLSRTRIFPKLTELLRDAWSQDPTGPLCRRLIDILETRPASALGLSDADVSALPEDLRNALRLRDA